MIVKFKVDDLNKVLSTFKVILNDAVITEDQRNIIFWNSEHGFKVVARNNIVDCICDIKAEVDAQENEMVNIRYKELDGVLCAFKSLKVTKATDIEFDFGVNCISVTVYEEPADAESEYADRLYRTNRYTLGLVKSVAESVRKEILSVSLSTEGTPVKGQEITKYFNALLPTTKDFRDGVATRFNITDKYMYTTPQAFVAIMKNDIPTLHDLILNRTTAEFMKSFFDIEETANVYIEEVSADMRMVRLTNSHACALIKAQSTAKVFKIDSYVTIPKEGVAVDKKYFCDIMKRFDSSENVKVTIKPDEVVLKQSRVTVSVPVYTGRLPDTFTELSFTTNTSVLGGLVFAHFTAGSLLFIYYTATDNKWNITFTDDTQAADGTHLWWTMASFRK